MLHLFFNETSFVHANYFPSNFTLRLLIRSLKASMILVQGSSFSSHDSSSLVAVIVGVHREIDR